MMNYHLFEPGVYSSRRKQLADTVGNGLLLLLGNEDSSMNYADNCYPFRQDSSFLYYFGLDLPGLAAIIDCDSGETILFGKEAGMDDIIWTGPLPSLKELAGLVNITRTGDLAALQHLLVIAKQQNRAIHILPPYRPGNKIKLAALLQAGTDGLENYVSVSLVKAVVTQREIKTTIEVAEIEKAVDISVDMHLAAMQFARPGMREYEVAAKVEAVALAADGRLSYPIILTVNGQTLHNHYHGNKIEEGKMILVDAGAENKMHYAGDLTRTFPAGKRFDTRQKEIYQVVLDALELAVTLLRPGITFKEVHRQACVKLMEGLKTLNLVKGDPQEAVTAGAHTLFFQCGLGHMMGLDVHDMEDLGEEYVGYTSDLLKGKEFGWKSLRLGKELKAGFVLTVEPGIYIIPELIDRWQATQMHAAFINYDLLAGYRNFGGIRIEDNFLITENGYRKLGKELPKSITEIENLREQTFFW